MDILTVAQQRLLFEGFWKVIRIMKSSSINFFWIFIFVFLFLFVWGVLCAVLKNLLNLDTWKKWENDPMWLSTNMTRVFFHYSKVLRRFISTLFDFNCKLHWWEFAYKSNCNQDRINLHCVTHSAITWRCLGGLSLVNSRKAGEKKRSNDLFAPVLIWCGVCMWKVFSFR